MKKRDRPLSKHDDSVNPIISQVDIMSLPVFLASDIVPSNFDGKLYVDGELSVSISSEKLLAKDADIFHSLIHFAKQDDFKFDKVEFVPLQIIKFMRWPVSGQSYKRLEKGLKHLRRVEINIRIKSKKMQGLIAFPLFYKLEYYTSMKAENLEQPPLFKSSIEFSKELLAFCREGRLKSLHPIYFFLKSRMEKRLFELISVKASDLDQWKIKLFTLKDLIPLVGERYEYQSAIIQNIQTALNRLKKQEIIFDFNFERSETTKDKYLIITPNPDYFYSQSRPRKKDFAQRKKALPAASQPPPQKKNPLLQELCNRGITESTADELLKNHKENVIALQIEHFDFMTEKAKKDQTVTSPSCGWLVKAIEGNWTPPPDFKTKADREKEALKIRLGREAKFLLKKKKYEDAIVAAKEILKLENNQTADEIISESKNELKKIKKEEKIENFKKELTPEQLAHFEDMAEKRIMEIPIANGLYKGDKKSMVFKGWLYKVLWEAICKNSK